jgi:hypothetical protein
MKAQQRANQVNKIILTLMQTSTKIVPHASHYAKEMNQRPHRPPPWAIRRTDMYEAENRPLYRR